MTLANMQWVNYDFFFVLWEQNSQNNVNKKDFNPVSPKEKRNAEI
jgi:hypothetical protein